jgi:hypothetical protein
MSFACELNYSLCNAALLRSKLIASKEMKVMLREIAPLKGGTLTIAMRIERAIKMAIWSKHPIKRHAREQWESGDKRYRVAVTQ